MSLFFSGVKDRETNRLAKEKVNVETTNVDTGKPIIQPTVEPRYNEGTGKIIRYITRFCSIEVLFHIFY